MFYPKSALLLFCLLLFAAPLFAHPGLPYELTTPQVVSLNRMPMRVHAFAYENQSLAQLYSSDFESWVHVIQNISFPKTYYYHPPRKANSYLFPYTLVLPFAFSR
ncbi:hypothetical protein TH63_05030 [Rufibacter radiotolerans]|uniref:Uncharacterized protein n=1 Tax=Rufibacter radiotolerans TaxID=1379910 RepID=A0A0H4VMP9_9BACT|nr:hypothetical protein TH63_05030 [Rufibacter radiotolerans]